jgi:hypothetical protein
MGGIGTRTKVPLIFVICLSKVTKIAKKCFDPVTASLLVTTFWEIHYIRVKMGIKPRSLKI